MEKAAHRAGTNISPGRRSFQKFPVRSQGANWNEYNGQVHGFIEFHLNSDSENTLKDDTVPEKDNSGWLYSKSN